MRREVKYRVLGKLRFSLEDDEDGGWSIMCRDEQGTVTEEKLAPMKPQGFVTREMAEGAFDRIVQHRERQETQ